MMSSWVLIPLMLFNKHKAAPSTVAQHSNMQSRKLSAQMKHTMRIMPALTRWGCSRLCIEEVHLELHGLWQQACKK